MKILEREISLRDETRAEEQTRQALSAEDYRQRVDPLTETQAELSGRVKKIITDLLALPDGAESFQQELALMSRVAEVMDEATGLLAQPETGPETIAAETEAIELLLMAKRMKPKGGGSAGSAPGGGSTGTTDQSALALLGSGSEENAGDPEREVTQSTGTTGSELPAEFRAGLDAYFGALEASQSE